MITILSKFSSDLYNENPISLKSLLVLGGARSGKSRYAQNLAESASLGLGAKIVHRAVEFSSQQLRLPPNRLGVMEDD
jgi:Cobinamide kinase / cobinamide phosphate guanyltransferase